MGDALPPEGETAPRGDGGGTGGRDRCRRQRVGLNLVQAISLFFLCDGNNLFPSGRDMDAPDHLLKLNNIMTIIHDMNLRSLDLNLLVVFEALMRKRNVTHAAKDIGLSQPAFSNALSRLRERLGDELFVRSPSGMRPTAWALELSGPIKAALSGIEDALDSASFNPETSQRSFTIATEDYGLMTLIPPLLERIRKTAPGLSIRTITASINSGEYLDTQAADIALISWPDPPDRFVSEPLFDGDWVCVMRPDHPLAGAPLDLDAYTSAQHLLVSTRSEPSGWVDDVLAQSGRTRQVVLTMATFAPTPLALEATDLIMACPKPMGEVFAKRMGLAITACPVTAPPAYRSIDMVWHARLGGHPAQTWLRRQLREVADLIEG